MGPLTFSVKTLNIRFFNHKSFARNASPWRESFRFPDARDHVCPYAPDGDVIAFLGAELMFNRFVAGLCLALFAFPSVANAGVVLTSTLGTNGNAQGKIIGKTSSDTNGAGLVFTTGSSSSWKLNTINLALTTGTGGAYAYSGGTVSFYLYRMGAGTSPLTASSLTYVGTTNVALASFTGNATTKSFDLSGLANLAAGTQYFLGMNATGYVGDQTVANDFLKISGTTATPSAANSSGWSVSTNYSFMLANYSNAPTGTNNFSSSTSNVAYSYALTQNVIAGIGFEIDAAAVPEPGTLVLFGSALAAGGAGAFLKRRKQKTATV